MSSPKPLTRVAGIFARDRYALPEAWRMPLLTLAATFLVLFVLTFSAWQAMASQWWNISTYNHILFVPLIAGWLVHGRWKELSQLTPAAWWPGLLPLVAALLLWLVGAVAGVNTASQLGAVLALQALVLAVLGPRITLGLAFPLAYLIFLVPFGDELVPTLQMVTAKLVIWLTEWSGIPAIIDGVFIDTPAGLFEVAEACSGVKFLVAMIALGVLVAYTCFTRWSHRAIFMAVAIVLPIVANGVRAWGTIYIAQSQGIQFAEGFDHIFYGWVFFAMVVGMLLACAWRWFDRDPDDLGLDFEMRPGHFAVTLGAMALPVTAALLIFAMGGVGIWHMLARQNEADSPAQIALLDVDGWRMAAYQPKVPWEPRATGADHRLLGRYEMVDGKQVDVFIAFYTAQEEGREASAYGEGALNTNTVWRWLQPGPAAERATSDYLLALGQHRRLAQTTYRTGDLTTGSAAKLKLANIRHRLLLAPKPTMMLILSSELQDGAQAKASIDTFRQTIGDEGEWLDRIVKLR